ncbi:DUF4132 domain-containing protein [Conchiformibius kuhniae]|uniref:DUF4132 domain-containing protein n=1 Tax=Conchiformibius kuhniae TaxID=211502 RepID=A0A8T9MWT4_9NEIS|nr:DUF4132 domain-containing protein [Conchiformibius kuhniae]
MNFPEITPEQSRQFAQYMKQLEKECIANLPNSWASWKAKPTEIYQQQLSRLPADEQIALLVYCINALHQTKKEIYKTAEFAFSAALWHQKLSFTTHQAAWLLNNLFQSSENYFLIWLNYPLLLVFKQIARQHADHVDDELRQAIQKAQKQYTQTMEASKEKTQVLQLMVELLGDNNTPAFPEQDPFSEAHNPELAELPNAQQQKWAKILLLVLNSKAGKPTAKFQKAMRGHVDALGADVFRAQVMTWFAWIVRHPYEEVQHERYGYFYSLQPVRGANISMVKGLVWACAWCSDEALLQSLSALALRCYEKQPYVSVSELTSIGNACLYALAQADLNGIRHLSRLLLRVRAANTRKTIIKYLDEAAERYGVSRETIEDMAADDFGLQNGSRTENFDGGYACRLQITGVGKSELQWFKPDGSPQKTVPSAVKTQCAEQLKALKTIQKSLNQSLTAQRDRLDRAMRSERRISRQHLQQYYLQHGMMGYLTQSLIWHFFQDEHDTQGTPALCCDGVWLNHAGEAVDVANHAQAMLWHPVSARADEILAWRKLLADKQIRQPFKQAYREIYLLTDAEIHTRTYSNRFAAHVLKQHQYISLAKLRDWQGSLQGAWDGGDSPIISLALPEYGLRAEFWTNAVNTDDGWVESGIWQYVTTDQVRFYHAEATEPMPLIDVHPRAFSEVMRDVDLFVGVASIGNDPNWQDNGGLPQYFSYWQRYSFGDLGEVAKNRKAVLETLLPRLKIGKVAKIEGNFLVVTGKIRSYKIHIGSSNILMTPNDRYLCIVPDRSKKDPTQGLFVPFEGDNMLSLVLSKALLLADDDKITDATIVSQIQSR